MRLSILQFPKEQLFPFHCLRAPSILLHSVLTFWGRSLIYAAASSCLPWTSPLPSPILSTLALIINSPQPYRQQISQLFLQMHPLPLHQVSFFHPQLLCPHRGQHSGFYRSCDCSLYFLDKSNSLLDFHGLGAASCSTHFLIIATFSIPLARPTSCFRIFQNGLPSYNYCVCFKNYAVTLSVTSIN